MIRQLSAMALGLMLLGLSIGIAQAQTDSTVAGWVISFLPKGETVKTSTCIDLPKAVIKAIKAHPKHAKAIVRYVFSQLIATDNCKALALIDAIIASLPQDEIAELISVAIGSLSSAIDPATGQSALSALASAITQQAMTDDPGLASAILAAIGAAAPAGQQGLQGLGGGPGSVTNPANLSNTTGPVNSPSQ
jgi:hypothetical protein